MGEGESRNLLDIVQIFYIDSTGEVSSVKLTALIIALVGLFDAML